MILGLGSDLVDIRRIERTIERFSGYLEARVETGEIAIGDLALAASQFMLLCQASLFLPQLFQIAPPPSVERMTEVVESATQMFLAAYAAKA